MSAVNIRTNIETASDYTASNFAASAIPMPDRAAPYVTSERMGRILQELKDRQQYLEQMETRLKTALETAPAGTLRISRSAGRTQYYHRTRRSDRKGTYIPQKQLDQVRALAQKDYNQKLLKAVQSEHRAISACLKLSPPSMPEEIYGRLPEHRKPLVTPAVETDEQFLEKWRKESYHGKAFPEGFPELLTDRGERVRSKSEMIIANMLEKAGIPYKYEYPVRLKGIGTVYPDFAVLNRRLRKEIYWEHLGMMDDSEYAEKAIRKIASYEKSGIYQGDRLVLTYETRSVPINVRQLKGIIEHFFL